MSANSSSAGGNTRITISINKPDGTLQKFNTKKSDRFRRMDKVYAEVNDLYISPIRFFYKGNQLQPRNTPNEVQMDEGDRIVMFFYFGGSLY